LSECNLEGLDKHQGRITIPPIPVNSMPVRALHPDCMTSNPPSRPHSGTLMQKCKHPRVQIVSREEDAEFVECKECGEIFESSEFKDMNIEEGSQSSES
jgi:hypothetical protein